MVKLTISVDTKKSVLQVSKSSPASSAKALHFSEASTGMLLMLYSELELFQTVQALEKLLSIQLLDFADCKSRSCNADSTQVKIPLNTFSFCA